jgi:hypothetical protein
LDFEKIPRGLKPLFSGFKVARFQSLKVSRFQGLKNPQPDKHEALKILATFETLQP